MPIPDQRPIPGRLPILVGVMRLMILGVIPGCAGFLQEPLLPVEVERSQQVLETLRQKEATISTLRGLFQASISGRGLPLSQDLNGIVAYQEPDKVHLKGFIRLGVPVLDFYREGNHYKLFFPGEGKVVSGQIEGTLPGSEWDQTVRLSLRALDAVLGKIAGLSSSDVHVWQNDQYYRIDMPMPQTGHPSMQPDVLVRTWVDQKTLELQTIEYYQSYEDLVVTVECEDYRDVKDTRSAEPALLRLPFRVKATDHRTMGGTVTLTFREFIVNAA